MAFDFKEIKRCGARCRTKGDAPCLGPAMKNGRCRMHGGVFSRLEKHGRATLKAKAERKKERAFLKEMKNLNIQLVNIMNTAPDNKDRLDNLTETEISQFFESLLCKCKEKGIYSVIETAKEMGVPYDKVKEWANANEEWTLALDLCRGHCGSHAMTDGLHFKLSEKLAIKYYMENENEFKKHHQKS